jgi:hypothetical protein
LLFVFLCPSMGHGAAPDSTADATSALVRILAEIETGTVLKVRTREQQLLQGELVRHDASAFVLGVDALDDVSVEASRVETLWIDAGNKSAKGMGWGGRR